MNRKYTRNAGRVRHLYEPTAHHEPPAPNLNRVRRIPRTHLTPGTVVWAHVPFEDADAEKTRPAVVVRRSRRDIELFPGTSSESRFRHPTRYMEIEDLDMAGLARPTGVRLTSVVVDIIEIIEIVGSLGDDDRRVILDDAFYLGIAVDAGSAANHEWAVA